MSRINPRTTPGSKDIVPVKILCVPTQILAPVEFYQVKRELCSVDFLRLLESRCFDTCFDCPLLHLRYQPIFVVCYYLLYLSYLAMC